MPLTNKYIKYSPEITLEIFTLIWNKLINSGWGEYSNKTIEESYSQFKSRYNHLTNQKNKIFNTHVCPYSLNYKEITVQEILGYDPFVKDNFVLPEKWCILADGYGDIGKYFNKQSAGKCYTYELGYYHRFNDGNQDITIGGNLNKSFHKYNIKKHYVEITFEQFKKYVLKSTEEPKDESKEVIPEYVECIYNNGTLKNNLLIGKIYKVNKKSSTIENIVLEDYPMSGIYRGLSISGSTIISKYTGFKPSTKEAFDAQNQPKQPLKQAVHCTTQEEWDFVISKFNPMGLKYTQFDKYKSNSIIIFSEEQNKIYYGSYSNKNETSFKEILSFQEWCDLNGYKMKSNIDLTGRYLKALIDGPQSTAYKKGDIVEIFKKESSNQYRIGKVGGVWWTYTTNNGTESQWELLPEDYKMEKEIKFEVGKWYKLDNWISRFNHLERDYKFYGENINTITGFVDKSGWMDLNKHTPIEISIEEIQQYLPDNHYDKIKRDIKFEVGDYVILRGNGTGNGVWEDDELTTQLLDLNTKNTGGGNINPDFNFKYKNCIFGTKSKHIIRHATPEEINNHLISIGQIPAGEPLNNGIEPNKDGVFKYKTVPGTSWSGGTIQNHLEAMIPTTGNCYDKEFSTSVIPEYLLNTQKKAEVEFNYLPEPK